MDNEIPRLRAAEAQPEKDPRLEELSRLAGELGFAEPAELSDLRAEAVAQLRKSPELGLQAATAYQVAAGTWVEAQPPDSIAYLGFRLMSATIWLQAGAIDKGLDDLWETAYQVGQTPGIESLRETLEAFVEAF